MTPGPADSTAAPSVAASQQAPRQAPTLLVTLTGDDRPGVTARLFDRLARGDDAPAAEVVVLDVEQVVVRGRLVLGVLLGGAGVTGGADSRAGRAAVDVAGELGMVVTLEPGAAEEDPRRRGRVHVTLLGRPLRPATLAAVAGRLADLDANIDRIVRLAAYPVTSIELEVSGSDVAALRAALAGVAASHRADIAVQPAGLHRRATRLVLMDVDSTLIQDEVIELLARRAGCATEVAAITERAMRGELDFEQSLRQRVALLRGLPESEVAAVREEVRLAPGARTLVRTLKRLGYQVGVVSGGFTQVTDALAADLGLDFARANTLEVDAGRLTGAVIGPVVDRAAKATALADFAAAAGVPLDQTVAIGDGANDLDMLAAAGLGVAFNAKPVVREAADTSVTVPFLDTVLYLLGISREDVEAADQAAGIATPAPPVP